MISTVSLAAVLLRSTQNTCAPSRANVTAVALPLPQPGPIEPAPTTIAVLPLSRCIDFLPDLLVIVRTPASSWHWRRADARISPTAYGNCQRCTAAIRRRRRNWPAPVPAAARALAPIETKSGWHSIYNWRRGDAASYWQDRGSPRNLAAAKPARQRPVLDLGERHNACSSYSWIIL